MIRIVLDTNILLTSFSAKSATHWVAHALKTNKFELAFTTEILAEYEEKFNEHWNASVAENVVKTILELSTSIAVTVYYQLNLITQDQDDNKFADCAFASNADYLVTNDSHFNSLKKLTFPQIRVVSLDEFKQTLINKNLI